MADHDKKDPKKRLGFAPRAAVAAAYAGAPALTNAMLVGMPGKLTNLLRSGQAIDAEYGTPIEDIAAFSKQDVGAIRAFAAEKGVDVPIVAEGGILGGNSGAVPAPSRLNEILAGLSGRELPESHIALDSTSVPAAMHEIGHLAPASKSKLLSALYGEAKQDLSPRGPIGHIARGAVAVNAFAPPGEGASRTRRFAYDHAPELVGATYLPELIEEGRATAQAVMGAKKYGPGAAAALRELLPAFGTYLGGAASAVLATLLAKKLGKTLSDHVNEQKDAHEHEKTGGDPLYGLGRGVLAKVAAGLKMPVHEVESPGALRAGAASAWRIGGAAPKPKTTTPSGGGRSHAKSMPTPKPPSNHAYHQDTIKSMNDPARGARLSKPIL